MGNIKDIFRQSSVFGSLEEADVIHLEQFFEKWEISPGDILATAKDRVQYFFLIGQGTLLLSMDEDRAVVLDTAGDFVGLELLSARGVCKTTVTVLEKGCVYAISSHDFLAFIQQDSEGAATVMYGWQEFLDNTAAFAKKIEDVSLLPSF